MRPLSPRGWVCQAKQSGDTSISSSTSCWCGAWRPARKCRQAPGQIAQVYVRDSGLVHALLGLGSLEVLGHPVVGGSWEGFCIEALLAAASAGTEPFFYRTSAGAELDLVLRLPGARLGDRDQAYDRAKGVARCRRGGRHQGQPEAVDERREHDVAVAEGVRGAPLEQGDGLSRAR